MKEKKESEQLSKDDEARRRLLKMGVYAPPAILGVMLRPSEALAAKIPGQTLTCKGGGMIVVSAGGNACCPCVPTDPKYNPLKCAQERCGLGDCASCGNLVFTKNKKCTKKVAKSGCGVCVNTGGGTWIIR